MYCQSCFKRIKQTVGHCPIFRYMTIPAHYRCAKSWFGRKRDEVTEEAGAVESP